MTRAMSTVLAAMVMGLAAMTAAGQVTGARRPGASPASQPVGRALEGKPTLEVLYVQLLKPLKPGERSAVLGRFDSPLSGVVPGIKVVVRVSVPEMTITSVPEGALRLARFADDLRTELGDGRQTPTHPGLGGPRESPVAPDGQSCTIEIGSDRLPAAGAKQILASGTVVLRCGRGERTVEQKDFAPAVGKTIDAGGVTLRLSEMAAAPERGGTGGGGVLLTFASDAADAVRSLQFIAPDGTKLAAKAIVRRYESLTTTGRLQYVLPSVPDSMTVRVMLFEKVELISVPIDLAVGVGI